MWCLSKVRQPEDLDDRQTKCRPETVSLRKVRRESLLPSDFQQKSQKGASI